MKGQLTRERIDKWVFNQRRFLAPLVMLYVAFVIANVGNSISLLDFYPTNEVVTAIVLYLLNALYDLLMKWSGK